MKTPTVIIIVIVVAILGFLLIYSQQGSTPANLGQEQAAVEPGQAPAASSEGAAKEAPATGADSGNK